MKQTNYKKLKEEFDKKVSALMDECPHKRSTKWMEVHWAPGHSSGTSIKKCLRCNAKTREYKTMTHCLNCGNLQSSFILNCLACKSDKIEHVTVKINYTEYKEQNKKLRESLKINNELMEELKVAEKLKKIPGIKKKLKKIKKIMEKNKKK